MLNIKLEKVMVLTAVLSSISLAGCNDSSGSSDSSSDGSTDNQAEEKTGVFLDSPVSGISYKTATQQGKTNGSGEFQYREGEEVIFSIGDLTFPSVPAQETVTPLTLAGTADISDQEPLNMVRLFMSLDADCNPSNGIEIAEAADKAATGLTVAFDDSDFATQVANLVANAGQTNSDCTSLVSTGTALDHFQNSLKEAGIGFVSTNAALARDSQPIAPEHSLDQVPEFFSGEWEGAGAQTSGQSWTIDAEISRADSSISYPSIPCSGEWRLIAASSDQVIFREDITRNETNCVDNGVVVLTKTGERSIDYDFYRGITEGQPTAFDAVGAMIKR